MSIKPARAMWFSLAAALATALAVAIVGEVTLPGELEAQDPRIPARLDPETAAAVRIVIDSAQRVSGLPSEPLVDRALEAKAKGATNSAIVAAVRRYWGNYATARAALGDRSTVPELEAASSALDAGLSSRDLSRIRAAAPRRPVTTALLVVSDLVVHEVPVVNATTLVMSLLRAGVRDSELMAFQGKVRVDISRGANPAASADARAKGAMVVRGR